MRFLAFSRISAGFFFSSPIQAWGAIAQYKFPNPYIPLQVKLETLFTDIVFKAQAEFALKQMLSKGKKGKKKGKK